MSIFFFKQKTAYEMRISDWSSDVCSSDLQALASDNAGWKRYPVEIDATLAGGHLALTLAFSVEYSSTCPASAALSRQLNAERFAADFAAARPLSTGVVHRSEEHTSELQSLMRISYAVFCLKKKSLELSLMYTATTNHYALHS